MKKSQAELEKRIEEVKREEQERQKRLHSELLSLLNEIHQGTQVMLESLPASTEQVCKIVEQSAGKNEEILRDGMRKLEDCTTVLSDNAEGMNASIQEIVRLLLTLDEGNRLVIAKMLLHDLGD